MTCRWRIKSASAFAAMVVFWSAPASGFAVSASGPLLVMHNPWTATETFQRVSRGMVAIYPHNIHSSVALLALPMSSSGTTADVVFDSLAIAPQKMEPPHVRTPSAESDGLQAVITHKLERLSHLLTQAREKRERAEILKDLCLLQETCKFNFYE